MKTLEIETEQYTSIDLTPLLSSNLQTLGLKSCKIPDLNSVKKAAKLEHLSLVDCSTADYTPLASLKSLRGLNLAGSDIKDLAQLSGLDSLQFLDLSRCVAAKVLDPLVALTGLQTLNLLLTKSDGLLNLTPLQKLPNLKNINTDAAEITYDDPGIRGDPY